MGTLTMGQTAQGPTPTWAFHSKPDLHLGQQDLHLQLTSGGPVPKHAALSGKMVPPDCCSLVLPPKTDLGAFRSLCMLTFPAHCQAHRGALTIP